MSLVQDYAYKFGCGRYIQGEGVLENIGDEALKLGKKAYVIGGATGIGLTRDVMEKSFDKSGVGYSFNVYTGQCSTESAKKILEEINEEKYDIIIGAGGGKIMDFAKLIADIGGFPVINVPTSSATCAACTTLCVLYDDSGKTVGNYYLPKEVDVVFAEMNILCEQPVRLFASGFFDSLAKYIEIKNGNPYMNSDNFSYDLMSAGILAEHIYKRLTGIFDGAIDDLNNKKVSPAISEAVFLALPVTSTVSGISRGFNQSAIAHELYYQIRTNFTKEAKDYLHGEIVAVGMITQSFYNQNPEETQYICELMKSLGMPVSMAEIGIESNEKNYELLCNNLINSVFVVDDEEHKTRLKEAMKLIF